ncbi:hypothetical protein NQP46_31925 [Streptomyces albus]|nr:hypothetical protein NQP46_31925 [Streptomyces albus]
MFAHALMFAAELVRHDSRPAWLTRLWSAFADSFVPGWYDSGTGQIAIPIGQAALYLAVPLGLLFYVRHRIGPRTWRRLHRFVLAVYVLSVWHTLLYGTNVWYGEWPRTVLWLLQIPVALLLVVRLARPARRAERLGSPAAPAGPGCRSDRPRARASRGRRGRRRHPRRGGQRSRRRPRPPRRPVGEHPARPRLRVSDAPGQRPPAPPAVVAPRRGPSLFLEPQRRGRQGSGGR